MMEQKLITQGGILDYDSDFLPLTHADQLLFFLRNNVEWEQKHYTHFKTGQQYPQPRLTAWYADDTDMAYSYSGVTQKVQKWLPELLDLKKMIENVTGANYNSVLLNLYRTGADSVGMHADNEKELGTNANIASVSLGATRRFELAYQTEKLVYNLTHGSLLVMSGTTQHHWKHGIPKADCREPRINLTFRKFKV